MEKDNKNLTDSQKDIQFNEAISLVLKDSRAVYLYKKSEKICKAVFMITNSIDSNSGVVNYKDNVIVEPIRKTALGLVEVTSSIISSGYSIGQSENIIKDAIIKLVSLISMSDIAVAGKVISEPHFKIVKYQMEILVTELHSYLKTLRDSEEGMLSNSLFEVSDIVSNMNMINMPSANMSGFKSNQVSGNANNGANNSRSIHNQNKSVGSMSTNSSRNIMLAVSGVPGTSVGIGENKSENKNERQKTILDTIRNRGESSIKDLVSVIKGCSEKTIQRELISLVQNGALSKTGERRWSRYSIAN